MTDFLYPFIERTERDATPLLVDLATSARAKAATSRQLRAATLEGSAAAIEETGTAMAARFGAGGTLYTFGNGGSATDAAGIATLFARPPSGPPLPARSLAADEAILTALGNDVGFELVFSRQLIAHARPGDIALAVSTSGGSRNVLVALEEARRRGLLTVGLSGYGGGAMAVAGLEHCIVVRSDSVHRIQEAEAAVAVALWRAVHAAVLTALTARPTTGEGELHAP